jgi:RimJ/RimL family protein N-acetyltransferase
VTEKQISDHYKTRASSALYFVITYDGGAIGYFELDRVDMKSKSCVICRYIIKPELRSKGYGTVALREIKRYAFDELRLNRIYLSVFDFNTAAIKCYGRAGFREVERNRRENGGVAIKMEAVRI